MNDMSKLNESSLKMSNDELLNVVKASINVLYKKNKKFISIINGLKNGNDSFSDKLLHDMLQGVYQALLDYSRSNNKTAHATIKKNKSFVAESLKDYKDAGKSNEWKIGYAIILCLISNKSSAKLRTYAKLYMETKAARKNSEEWELSDNEKEFGKLFSEYIQLALDKINGAEDSNSNNDSENNSNDLNVNNDSSDDSRSEDDKTNNDNNLGTFLGIPPVNFSVPGSAVEFYWPWEITSNPVNVSELLLLISSTGYQDDDLDMSTHAVFTTDGKYALGVAKKSNNAYMYVLKKNDNHYWDPLMIGERVVFLEYNFTRTFNDNALCLLSMCNWIFPIRVKK